MTKLMRMAFRNVRRNPRRTVINVLAIFIGVALVGTLSGVSNGFVRLQVENTVLGQTGALQVHRVGYLEAVEGSPLDNTVPADQEVVARIENVRHVTGYTGRIQFSGQLSSGTSQTGVVARALELSSETTVLPRAGMDILDGGRPLTERDSRAVLLGEELADSFNAVTSEEKPTAPVRNGVPPTDTLTLESTNPAGRVNALPVHVVGRLRSGLPFQNKHVITIPMTLARELLELHEQVTEFAIAVDDLRNVERVAETLSLSLGPAFEVTTWTDLAPVAREAIERSAFLLRSITLVLLVIVLTGILNTMLMTVYERVREIGTMLALGTRRSQVMRLLLYEAAFLGALGGLLGAGAAKGIVAVLHRHGLPIPSTGNAPPDLILPTLSTPYLVTTVLVASGVCLLATVYPAWKASRLNPVDALRAT